MASDAPVRFQLRSGETWRDPFPMYAALREHDPVHHVAAGDFWILTRFDDVWAAACDPATFSSSQGLTVAYDEIGATGLGDNMPMVFLDPPAHTEFRRLVTRDLTPRRVSTIEPSTSLPISSNRCRASWSHTTSVCRPKTARCSIAGPKRPFKPRQGALRVPIRPRSWS
jgi:cytochrome P450